MAKPDTTWKNDRAVFLKEKPDPARLQVYRPDLAPLHAYSLVTVHWNRERCPDCIRDIYPGTEAALDIDTLAVFCQACTKSHLLRLVEAASKPRPQPKKKSRRPSQPSAEDQQLAYFDEIADLRPYYDTPLSDA